MDLPEFLDEIGCVIPLRADEGDVHARAIGVPTEAGVGLAIRFDAVSDYGRQQMGGAVMIGFHSLDEWRRLVTMVDLAITDAEALKNV